MPVSFFTSTPPGTVGYTNMCLAYYTSSQTFVWSTTSTNSYLWMSNCAPSDTSSYFSQTSDWIGNPAESNVFVLSAWDSVKNRYTISSTIIDASGGAAVPSTFHGSATGNPGTILGASNGYAASPLFSVVNKISSKILSPSLPSLLTLFFP